MSKDIEAVWNETRPVVINNIKIYFLKRYPSEILKFFHSRIDYLVRQYANYLPSFVAQNEVEDLRTISQLEFFETLKIWDPSKSDEIWPLASARIRGAMKDHIRYITKSDPSRFYEWVTDAAYMYITLNKRADFATQIESGVQLKEAMECLTTREIKIINAYVKDDLTFQQISKQLGVSESQISRIYKKAIEKIRKQLKQD